MITDEIWPGGPVFIRSDDAFRLGTDSVLLSSFSQVRNTRALPNGTRALSRSGRACDLGCGTGIIAALLAWNDPTLLIDGIELQPEWADIARENIKLCRLEDRITILDGDLRRHRDFLEAGAYSLVVSNPPYYASGSGKSSEKDSTATAREERTCTIGDVCAAASYLTRWGGRFTLVHKPERLADIIYTLKENGLEPKRLRFVQHKATSAPNLVLIESHRGGKPSLIIEPPLIMTDENGNDTEEIKRIYHRG